MSDYILKSSTDSVQYVLEINYQALDYFGLINSFRVGIIIYIFVFFVVALILCIFIYIFWRLNSFIFSFRRKYPPTLKFMATFKITFFPEFNGAMLANLTVSLIFLFMLKYVYPALNFDSIDYDINRVTLSSTQIANA